MNKKEFMKKTSKIKQPKLIENSGDSVFISRYWIVEGIGGYFCTPLVRLSNREYLSRDHSAYYKRESAARNKYVRWLEEAVEK